MITRACDFCTRPVSAEVIELQTIRGTVALLSRQRWSIIARGGGIRLRIICPECNEYLLGALRSLSA